MRIPLSERLNGTVRILVECALHCHFKVNDKKQNEKSEDPPQ